MVKVGWHELEPELVNPTAAAQRTAHSDFAGAENVHKGCAEIPIKLIDQFDRNFWGMHLSTFRRSFE
jgi:hypothetical protein